MAGLKLFALLAALVVVMYVQQSTCAEGETEIEAQSTDIQVDMDDPNARCRCHGLKCSCCLRIRIRKWPLRVNLRVCVSIVYLKRNHGIAIAVYVNRRRVFHKEVSVRNPPRLCFGVYKAVSLCIRFYRVRVVNKHLHACLQIQARLFGRTIKRISLGCFKIPPRIEETEMPAIEGDALKFLSENNLNLRELVLEAIKQAGPEIFNSPEEFGTPEIEGDIVEETEDM